MKRVLIAVSAVLMFAGCAPKMGKDIVIDAEDGIRWENTKTEVVLGVLSLFGAPVERKPIRLGADLRVINRWHSDVKLVSLTYTLDDANETVAGGEAIADPLHPLVVASGSEKRIPITLRVDPAKISPSRLLGFIRSERKLFLKGDAVVEVWGLNRHYHFEREATPLIRKALKKS